MTQKEKLINEYFTLKNQYEVNEGKEVQKFDNFVARGDYYYYSKHYKVYELQEMIANMKASLERQAFEKQKKDYYNTEEGMKIKEELTAQLDAIRDEHDELEKMISKKVDTLITKALGDKFATVFATGYKSVKIEVGIKEGENGLKFGHTFEVAYKENIQYVNGEWTKEYDFEMNYGTMGSFSLTANEDRVTYLNGMGQFVGNKELQNELQELFIDYITMENVICKRYNKIENQLKNPFEA